jgi:putative FmdB family regulatory protein
VDIGEDEMPIYEYKAADGVRCRLCMGRFEVRQGIDDEPLKTCPECGAAVRRLFSPPFLLRREALSDEDTFDSCGGEKDDGMGLEDGLPQDDVWE